MAYNKRQHLADNIAALELIFMRPEFCLTEEGRKVLNGYSGFGGLKCILNPAEKARTLKNERQTGSCFPKSDCCMNFCASIPKTKKNTGHTSKAFKNSVLTAFYTPEPVVTAMQESLQVPGIRPGRFLDPSAGTGMFISGFKGCSRSPLLREGQAHGKNTLSPLSRKAEWP